MPKLLYITLLILAPLVLGGATNNGGVGCITMGLAFGMAVNLAVF